MRLNSEYGAVTSTYIESFRKKVFLLFILLGIIFIVALYAISHGTYEIPISEVFFGLIGHAEGAARVVILNIRLPRVIAAVICGFALSVSGLGIQSVLKNPLGSPSTLGISQGAAFGAAFSIVVLGSKVLPVTIFAFAGAMVATVVILLLSYLKRLSPEAIILAGVAMASLFASATTLIQYMAVETELAMVVFWTFGDVARSNWREIGIMAAVTIPTCFLFMFFRWDLNSMASGEETAKGLGVSVNKVRIFSMIAASLVAALATAFHGVIAFVGLIAPHMARRLIGADHALLIPFSTVLGALLLLVADTLGRVLVGSGALPVGVITSFLGAPMFLYLLIRGYK